VANADFQARARHHLIDLAVRTGGPGDHRGEKGQDHRASIAHRRAHGRLARPMRRGNPPPLASVPHGSVGLPRGDRAHRGRVQRAHRGAPGRERLRSLHRAVGRARRARRACGRPPFEHGPRAACRARLRGAEPARIAACPSADPGALHHRARATGHPPQSRRRHHPSSLPSSSGRRRRPLNLALSLTPPQPGPSPTGERR